MGFCLSDRCQGHFILDTSTLSLRHEREREKKNGQKKTCARIHTHTEKQHDVSSPLQRDVLLIGLSLVTVWEDELSQRFLPGVVAAAPLF